MSGFNEEGTGLEEVEAMIRAAGDHVIPSRDLRPRLLDSVRSRRRTDRRRQWIAVVTLPSVVFFAAITNHAINARGTLSDAAPRQRVARAMASYRAEPSEGRIDRHFWGLADAFRLVQQQQAEAFSGQPVAEPNAKSIDSEGFDAQNDEPTPSE